MKRSLVFALTILLAACAPVTPPVDGSSQFSAGSDATVTANDIRVESPTANAKVKSPLAIAGQARGNWYFEASFPVEITDANGNQLAITPAQAQGDWMTTDFVPFSATLTFPAQSPGTTGWLIFHVDNASGEPSRDAMLKIPVKF